MSMDKNGWPTLTFWSAEYRASVKDTAGQNVGKEHRNAETPSPYILGNDFYLEEISTEKSGMIPGTS